MSDDLYTGNAGVDAGTHRGWLLGHFLPPGDVRHSADLEIKWGIHPAGDHRAQPVTGERRTAMHVLISGRFRIDFPARTVLLAEPGDYIVQSGLDHDWHAEEDSVVLTVRWPSVRGYG